MTTQLKGKIVIIGFGNIGKALARGLQKSSSASNIDLYVCDKNEFNTSETLPKGLNLSSLSYLSCKDIPNIKETLLLTEEDTLVICVKPQNFVSAIQTWKSVFIGNSKFPLIVSVLAGVTTDIIHNYVSQECPVVRCMPNIAATVDCAACCLSASTTTAKQYLERAKLIFDCVGKTWIVSEEQLDAVTGLSGSGPAYIYMIIEALSDGGVKMGLSRQLALELATQTVLGAAKLVQETGMHPAVLRDQVTTPGGTTISAIHELEKHGLRPMLISAVVTATEKSIDLAKTVEKRLDLKS